MRAGFAAVSRCHALAMVAIAILFLAAPTPERQAAAETLADNSAGAKEAGYRFGVFPMLPPLALDRMFQPIVESLSSGLQTPVHLRTKPTFETFAEEIARGGYDLIVAHPFLYVEAADKYGYLPVVRLSEPLVAVVFSRSESPLQQLKDLQGNVIGLPPPLAAVSEMVKSELLDIGLIPGSDIQIRHFASKMSCLHAVATGTVKACGLPRFVLGQLDLSHSREFKVIHETHPTPNIVIAAHPRVPEAERRRLRDVIVGWPHTAEGRAILIGADWRGFVDADDRDYDEIRHYNSRLQRQHAFREP
jgi:phosphonate transport system substrate-binding protein